MPKKITKISPQKDSERLNIYLDGEFSFGVYKNDLLKYDLFVGKELTEREITDISNNDTFGKCLNKAYNFLSFRPRTEKEMREKLLERFEAKDVDKTIEKLREINLINDSEFAEVWVRERSKSRGKSLLKLELVKKGVSKEIIDNSLRDIAIEDEVKLATALIKSKSKYQGLDKEGLYKKVAPYLARRGYNYEIIKEVINILVQNDL